MNAWELPQQLRVGEQEWKIRSDFRAVLDILNFFNDPEYEEDENGGSVWISCMRISEDAAGVMAGSSPAGHCVY